MSENECNHWHHKTSDDNTVYCDDCLEILAVQPYWWGTVNIGRMEQHFEKEGSNLNLGNLIEEYLGINKINITQVTLIVGEETWKTTHYIAFGVGGNQLMEADIHAMRNEHYIPTGLKFEVPTEVEAE